MRTKMAIALVIITAIFLGGCAAPPREVVIEKPIKGDLDLKLTDLTTQIINSLTETRRSRIAIIEFSDLDGNITEFGKYLSEELITRLFRTRKFEVVERQFLNKIIQEHKLAYTHFFDEESIKEIGKLLGVDAIASGSVTDLGRTIKVNARLIATETGSIFAVAAVEILKDERIAKMIGEKAETPYLVGPEPRPPKGYVWEDGVLRVTVESLKKIGKEAIMKIVFENISDEPIKVGLVTSRYAPTGAHFLDENGEKWKIKSDTAELNNPRNISPGNKIRSKMIFDTKGSTSGTIFDLFLESYRGHKYSLTIQNIKAH